GGPLVPPGQDSGPPQLFRSYSRFGHRSLSLQKEQAETHRQTSFVNPPCNTSRRSWRDCCFSTLDTPSSLNVESGRESMSVLRRFAYTKILAFSLALLVLSSCGGGGSGDGGGGTTGSGLPDLAITSFSAPSAGVAGNSYTVNVTVANVGSVTAAGVSAIIALAPTSDIATDFGMIGLGTSFAILGPGQSTV